MTEPVELVEPVPMRDPVWLRYLGGAVAVALGFVSAVWEAFLSPLAYQWTAGGHAHSVRVPIALVFALAGNLALVWFTRAVTGRTLAVVAPFVAWIVPMVAATARTTEGDLVVAGNNWVGLVTVFGGSLAFAGGAYWLTLRSLPARSGPSGPSGQSGPSRPDPSRALPSDGATR
jgi:hypothetical protein